MKNNFHELWDRINNLIKKTLILLISLLIITQVLLMNQTVKTFISRTDKLEGKSIADSQLFIKKGEIEISVENYSTLRPLIFYVNGNSQKTPAGKSIKLQVKNKDVIEVCGSDCSDTIVLKITEVSDNITVPELGKLIYVNNNMVMIDRIKME